MSDDLITKAIEALNTLVSMRSNKNTKQPDALFLEAEEKAISEAREKMKRASEFAKHRFTLASAFSNDPDKAVLAVLDSVVYSELISAKTIGEFKKGITRSEDWSERIKSAMEAKNDEKSKNN